MITKRNYEISLNLLKKRFNMKRKNDYLKSGFGVVSVLLGS